MKIYTVTRDEDDRIGYDEFDSFVCAAPDAHEARRMHPRGNYVWSKRTGGWHWQDTETGEISPETTCSHSWTTDIASLVVECLSEGPTFRGRKRIILASFRAG